MIHMKHIAAWPIPTSCNTGQLVAWLFD